MRRFAALSGNKLPRWRRLFNLYGCHLDVVERVAILRDLSPEIRTAISRDETSHPLFGAVPRGYRATVAQAQDTLLEVDVSLLAVHIDVVPVCTNARNHTRPRRMTIFITRRPAKLDNNHTDLLLGSSAVCIGSLALSLE
jgi:hypothetical protein